MFDITDNRGFHMTFANGWTVSVQWGRGNYCDNYHYDGRLGEPVQPSKTAEIAAWPENGDWYDFGNDTVKGYVTPDELLEFMNKVAAF